MTIFITLIRTLVIMHCSMQVQGFLHCTNLSIESSYLCTKKAKNAESLWGLLPCQSLSCPYFALVNFTAPPNCQITVHTFFNAEEFQGHFLSKKIYLVSIILQFIESTLGVQKVLLVAFMKKTLKLSNIFALLWNIIIENVRALERSDVEWSHGIFWKDLVNGHTTL